MIQKQSLISMIVPVYNTEPFLDQCLHSLSAQTIATDIQFIFIDDASTDGSLAILQRFAQQNAQLNTHIIANATNHGPSASRCTGIAMASAPYLMFVDSDDWIEPDMAECLLNAATTQNADIVTSPFYINTPNKQKTVMFPQEMTTISLNDAPVSVSYFSLWNKLISRPLIVDNGLLSIPGTDCWEDLSIVSRALTLAKRNVVTTRPLYHYRKFGQTSLTASRHKTILSQHLQYADMLAKWFLDQGAEFNNRYQPFLRRLKFAAKIKMLRGDVIEVTRWKNTYPEISSHIMSASSQYPLPSRLAFAALQHCPLCIALTFAKLVAACTHRRAQ